MLVLALAACGNESKEAPETSKKEESDAEKQVAEPKKDELTAVDLYKKAFEAMDEQNSMHVKMDVDHNAAAPEQDFNSSTKMNIDLDLVVEPFSLHQAAQTNVDNEKMLLEWYATDDVFYFYNEFEDIWFDLPEEDKEEFVGDITEEIDQFLFLELFEDFAKEFTVEETDDAYTIKLTSSGDKFEDLIDALVIDEMRDEFEEDEEVEIGIREISKMNIDFSIAKETFYITGFNLDLEVSLEVDGVEMIIVQKTNTVVDKLNEFDKVEIPQEVIDNAIEYNEEDYE